MVCGMKKENSVNFLQTVHLWWGWGLGGGTYSYRFSCAPPSPPFLKTQVKYGIMKVHAISCTIAADTLICHSISYLQLFWHVTVGSVEGQFTYTYWVSHYSKGYSVKSLVEWNDGML